MIKRKYPNFVIVMFTDTPGYTTTCPGGSANIAALGNFQTIFQNTTRTTPESNSCQYNVIRSWFSDDYSIFSEPLATRNLNPNGIIFAINSATFYSGIKQSVFVPPDYEPPPLESSIYSESAKYLSDLYKGVAGFLGVVLVSIKTDYVTCEFSGNDYESPTNFGDPRKGQCLGNNHFQRGEIDPLPPGETLFEEQLHTIERESFVNGIEEFRNNLSNGLENKFIVLEDVDKTQDYSQLIIDAITTLRENPNGDDLLPLDHIYNFLDDSPGFLETQCSDDYLRPADNLPYKKTVTDTIDIEFGGQTETLPASGIPSYENKFFPTSQWRMATQRIGGDESSPDYFDTLRNWDFTGIYNSLRNYYYEYSSQGNIDLVEYLEDTLDIDLVDVLFSGEYSYFDENVNFSYPDQWRSDFYYNQYFGGELSATSPYKQLIQNINKKINYQASNISETPFSTTFRYDTRDVNLKSNLVGGVGTKHFFFPMLSNLFVNENASISDTLGFFDSLESSRPGISNRSWIMNLTEFLTILGSNINNNWESNCKKICEYRWTTKDNLFLMPAMLSSQTYASIDLNRTDVLNREAWAGTTYENIKAIRTSDLNDFCRLAGEIGGFGKYGCQDDGLGNPTRGNQSFFSNITKKDFFPYLERERKTNDIWLHNITEEDGWDDDRCDRLRSEFQSFTFTDPNYGDVEYTGKLPLIYHAKENDNLYDVVYNTPSGSFVNPYHTDDETDQKFRDGYNFCKESRFKRITSNFPFSLESPVPHDYAISDIKETLSTIPFSLGSIQVRLDRGCYRSYGVETCDSAIDFQGNPRSLKRYTSWSNYVDHDLFFEDDSQPAAFGNSIFNTDDINVEGYDYLNGVLTSIDPDFKNADLYEIRLEGSIVTEPNFDSMIQTVTDLGIANKFVDDSMDRFGSEVRGSSFNIPLGVNFTTPELISIKRSVLAVYGFNIDGSRGTLDSDIIIKKEMVVEDIPINDSVGDFLPDSARSNFCSRMNYYNYEESDFEESDYSEEDYQNDYQNFSQQFNTEVTNTENYNQAQYFEDETKNCGAIFLNGKISGGSIGKGVLDFYDRSFPIRPRAGLQRLSYFKENLNNNETTNEIFQQPVSSCPCWMYYPVKDYLTYKENLGNSDDDILNFYAFGGDYAFSGEPTSFGYSSLSRYPTFIPTSYFENQASAGQPFDIFYPENPPFRNI